MVKAEVHQQANVQLGLYMGIIKHQLVRQSESCVKEHLNERIRGLIVYFW